jgi:hypothetical protein
MSDWADLYRELLSSDTVDTVDTVPMKNNLNKKPWSPPVTTLPSLPPSDTVDTVDTVAVEAGNINFRENNKSTAIKNPTPTPYSVNRVNSVIEREGRREGGRSLTISPSLDALERRQPKLIEDAEWMQAVDDARAFLASWCVTAERLGWTADDLFGLPPIPEKPTPNCRRLSRYDLTGLVWMLRGRPVVSIGPHSATVATPSGGQLTFTKPQRRYEHN